jgi:hypothetical protein
MQAASARGDELELDRLGRSAPKNTFDVPDFWGLQSGLERLAALYLLVQLDRTNLFERLSGWLEADFLGPEKEAKRRRERRWKALRFLSYQLVVSADAWRLLCGELSIDPEILLKDLPGFDTVRRMEGLARELDVTAEEALTYLREKRENADVGGDTRQSADRSYLPSAENEARSMQSYLAEQLARWS